MAPNKEFYDLSDGESEQKDMEWLENRRTVDGVGEYPVTIQTPNGKVLWAYIRPNASNLGEFTCHIPLFSTGQYANETLVNTNTVKWQGYAEENWKSLGYTLNETEKIFKFGARWQMNTDFGLTVERLMTLREEQEKWRKNTQARRSGNDQTSRVARGAAELLERELGWKVELRPLTAVTTGEAGGKLEK